ncbi:MAG TPA: glycoside hydrolase family 44 protein [Fibrobacteria bacterium]|nr:glycoside hydrolase family 44 protein [Fibrobacteria bacterium]
MLVLPLLIALSGNATIHPGVPGVAVRHDALGGVPLCVWNDSGLFTKLTPGIHAVDEHVFRYPNGSTSNQYHWNSDGHYDADSIWVASDSTFSPGWVGETIHRGTSYNQYSSVYQSLIDDGDTTTFWWSNPDHPDAPGWFEMDMGAATSIDSFALWLGNIRPDSVQIVRWPTNGSVYPLPHEQATAWTELARLPASSFVGFRLPSPISARYVGVRPIGRLDSGWQVREFQVLRLGTVVSNNIPDGANQTKVDAVSAIPAVRKRTYSSDWDFETYMNWIQSYPDAQPMICVNYGGGTPQEAAAWVHYANVVKHYGIHRWQIGNEIAGDWEDGGPVTAREYAERFVNYAQAMKAQDPSIEVVGPVFPSDQFTQNASGDFDGRSWMQGYLYYVDSVEKATSRLVDGIDFHTYPYWFNGVPAAQEMIDSCDGSGAAYDTLIALMGRTIANPASREILMTEYNTSTVSSSLEQTTSAGTATGLQLAHFIQRFGDRGVAVLWELFEGGGTGPDNTWGTLSEFDNPTQGEWSSLGDPPAATFWPKRTILRQWLDTAGGDTIEPVDQTTGARLFAVRNGGRVSILAFNLGPDSTTIALDPSLYPQGGDILSWGTGEFDWIGTTTDAQAMPDNGPSSRPIPVNWNGSARIPPYGFLVVRGSGRGSQPLRTVHWQLSRPGPTVADTVTVSGWSTSEGTHLTGGTWSAGGASGPLVATDGAWDGPCESWTARIPAANVGVGAWNLHVTVTDSVHDTARDSTPFQVSGTLRPVLLVSNFDNRSLTTSLKTSWTKYTADPLETVLTKIDTTKGLGSPYLKDTVSMDQPAGLAYTVYAAADFGVPLGLANSDTTRNLVGLLFDINTTFGNPAGTFTLYANTTTVKDYDNYSVSLPNTNGAWVRDTALFSDFHQAGWGVPVPFHVDSLNQVEFRGTGTGSMVIRLDNVAFLGTKGADYMVGIAPRSAHAPELAIYGQRLQVGIQGSWTLRLLSADGRTLTRWTGTGPTTLALPRTASTSWALLEGNALRRTLSIPPMSR